MRAVFTGCFLGFIVLLSGCGGGGSAGTPAVSTPVSAPNPPAVSSVKISGTITYDSVPHDSVSFGLDYTRTNKKPVRGLVVDLLGSSNTVIASTLTDGDGHYSFDADVDTQVKVRVNAHLSSGPEGKWDISVSDNTHGAKLYQLDGIMKSSGTVSAQTRDMHAGSGWTGADYGAERAAAPFAILDPLYEAVTILSHIDPHMQFPQLDVYWSSENRSLAGNRSNGEIGTTGYFKDGDAGEIYVLGEADRNTDEYDPHVILHEFAHYVEHRFSRYDTLGGHHNLGDKLDARVAFSEGWGHAFAAIVTGDPVYKDSAGQGQNTGIGFNMETVDRGEAGWFNETSIAAVLYDIYDDNNENSDFMSAGLGPIFKGLTSESFKSANAFATIYSFSESLTLETSVNASDLNILLASKSISGTGFTGDGEKNNGKILSSLPIYKSITVGGAPVNICSVDDAGNYNKLGNREFIQFTIAVDGLYKLSMQSLAGTTGRDPDFSIWQNGQHMTNVESSKADLEVFEGEMRAGDYLIEARDFYNINGVSSKRGDACFHIYIEAK